eukprot:COSAG02_NODE_8005_length_2749_cov_1.949811_2_plen_208_part_00
MRASCSVSELHAWFLDSVPIVVQNPLLRPIDATMYHVLDDWGLQARRVSSRPAPAVPGVLRAPFAAFLALRKCNATNPLQHWTVGGALPNRMWTTAPDGQRWCVAATNDFSQPGEVLPCDDPMYLPNASLDCTCGAGNAQVGCCHQIANVSANLTWVSPGAGPCVGGVPTPEYCTGGLESKVSDPLAVHTTDSLGYSILIALDALPM